MDKNLRESFLALVRLGMGHEQLQGTSSMFQESVDWLAIQALANLQGLSAILVDGIEHLPKNQRPPQALLLNWIGETLQFESQNTVQKKSACEMAELFHNNYIRTYVLKGEVIAECYPTPNHRTSVDMDCYLMPVNSGFDAWALGNDLIREKGYQVNTDFYKNSTFILPGLTVENHQYLTPFRGNSKLKALESVLQSLLYRDEGESKFDETWLYRPPVMVSALFMIEHAYSHFLHEGLTWRHVLDWMMFSRRRQSEINWAEFDAFVDKFGFRKFYESYLRLGQYLLGDLSEGKLSKLDRLMLEDIWAPLDLHETVRGFKGKLALAGNTWRARWKYRYFTDMTWVTALWIQVKGYLFIKEPKLS